MAHQMIAGKGFERAVVERHDAGSMLSCPAMIPWLILLGALSLAAWLYLLAFHGRYWRADQRLGSSHAAAAGATPTAWPPVFAVVPARNEVDVVARSVTSLLDQAYRGAFHIILVDDGSEDGTADVARAAASEHAEGARLTVIQAPSRPAGWVGKMWAVHNGILHAEGQRASGTAESETAGLPAYWLLTDADIVHHPGNLRRLVRQAVAGFDLVSLMVRLEHRGFWAGLLVPAFVYFFQQLYPFPRVNTPRASVAGAAGGCMLVDASALARAGGIEAIRGEIIDDCSLARRIKAHGPIWLGLSRHEHSIRPYDGLLGVWRMVARSAYTQLGHNPLLLILTVIGLSLIYLLPPILTLGWPVHQNPRVAALGLGAWLSMAGSYIPTLRIYDKSLAWALTLPLAALLYTGMTLDSARRHWLGRGAEWKGRRQAGKG